jgi:hypothetical protein
MFAYLGLRRPVRRLVVREVVVARVDSACKQTIERTPRRCGYEVPIERVDVTEIEDQPVPPVNGSVVKVPGLQARKKFVRSGSRL